MQLWKKIHDLMITKRLFLDPGAVVSGLTNTGVEVPIALGVVEARAAATTLSATVDNGKTILLNSTTAFATTLPAPAMGLRYKFIVTGIPGASAHTIVASGAIIKGSVGSADLNAAADSPITTGGTTISFTTTAAVGDYCELVSNGVNWFLSGNISIQTGMTIA